MPKAGKYDYPARDLEICIDFLVKANDMAKETSFKREGFAEAIGQKPKGGGFNVLVGSLSMYKLVEASGGYVRYTELAKTILFGESSEQEQAKSNAVRNVLLFADLYDKFEDSLTDERLRIFLREKASVGITEVNDLSFEVGKLFKRVVKHIKSNESIGGDNDLMKGQGDEVGAGTAQWKLISPYGSMIIKDRESLEAAQKLLSVAEKNYPKNGQPKIDSKSAKGKKDLGDRGNGVAAL